MEINLNTLQTPDDFLTFLIALGEKAKAFRQAQNLCAIDWPTLKRKNDGREVIEKLARSLRSRRRRRRGRRVHHWGVE